MVARNRSLEYSDHIGLVRKYAITYHARLLGGKIIGVDLDDVIGELSLAFVKAAHGYDPNAGYTFTAFLGRCFQNHFNKFAGKLMKEQYGDNEIRFDIDEETHHAKSRAGLGYVLEGDLQFAQTGDASPFLDAQCQQPTPEEYAIAVSELQAIWADKTLSLETRGYIAIICNPSQKVASAVVERIRSKFPTVRREIYDRFGVQLGWDIWAQDQHALSIAAARQRKAKGEIRA